MIEKLVTSERAREFWRDNQANNADNPVICAYRDCQAGGDILPGAPRVESWAAQDQWRHPGCWAAEQQAEAK